MLLPSLPYLHSPQPIHARSRPRGLYKGRGTPKQGLDLHPELRPAKRHRSEDTSSDDGEFEGYYLLEYSPEPSGSQFSDLDEPPPDTDSNHEDWEDLKELFARAAEQYEGRYCSSRLAPAVSRFCRRRRQRGPFAFTRRYPRKRAVSFARRGPLSAFR